MAGFEWTPINVGDIIRKTHIDELHDNIDYIYDNLADINYNSGAKDSYNDNEDKDEYTTVRGTANVGNQSDDRINEYDGENTNVKSNECATDEGGYDWAHKGGEVSTVFNQAECSSVYPPP